MKGSDVGCVGGLVSTNVRHRILENKMMHPAGARYSLNTPFPPVPSALPSGARTEEFWGLGIFFQNYSSP